MQSCREGRVGAVKKKEVLGVLAVLGIGALELLSTFLLYRGVQSGSVLSVRHAAAQPMAFLLQCLRECLLPAALLILFAIVLKKDFASALFFRLHGKWQHTVAAILTTVIIGFTLYGLITKQDKASILVSLLYYLVVVAFSEEFVIRDACTVPAGQLMAAALSAAECHFRHAASVPLRGVG